MIENKTIPNSETVDVESRERKPIEINQDWVSFLGVTLERGKGGVHTPDVRKFEQVLGSMTREDYLFVQQVAIALKLKQPILNESYSAAGKTTKVEMMAALLNQEVHYANCHNFDADVLIGKMTTDDTTKSGFGWKDGVVTRAVRDGGILFLDEYNFMRGDVRGRLHEILDSLIRGKDFVSLTENHNERVAVHPEFRLVAAQNPPGGEYGDREVLDPPQISRFVYIKGPGEMPKEQKVARVLSMFGKNGGTKESLKDDFIGEDANLTFEQFLEIPGCEEVMLQFVEFIDGFEQLRQKRKIAADQPQPPYSTFPRDQERVCRYIQMFYNGDIAETMRSALRYYFKNRMEKAEDRQIIEEQINHIRYVPKPGDSRRRSLEKDRHAQRSEREKEVNEAKEIFGYHYFGLEAIRNTFSIEIDLADVPKIPFDVETLRHAENLGQFLILRIESSEKFGPMTMEKMVSLVGKDGATLLDSDEGYISMEELLETETEEFCARRGMTIGEMLGDVFKEDSEDFLDDESSTLGEVESEKKAEKEAALATRLKSEIIFPGARKHCRKDFFTKETPRLAWALVSAEPLDGTINCTYLEQLDIIDRYLGNTVNIDGKLPFEYSSAISEYRDSRQIILRLLAENQHKLAAKAIAELKLNKLVRRSPAEIFYDALIYNTNIDDRKTLAEVWDWSSDFEGSSGQFLDMEFGKEGLKVNYVSPEKRFRTLGAYISRVK